MNTDKVYIVVLLVLGIVLFSNLAMFAFVRGSKSVKFDWFKTSNTFTQPFKMADEKLNELRKKVGELESDGRKSAQIPREDSVDGDHG